MGFIFRCPNLRQSCVLNPVIFYTPAPLPKTSLIQGKGSNSPSRAQRGGKEQGGAGIPTVGHESVKQSKNQGSLFQI